MMSTPPRPPVDLSNTAERVAVRRWRVYAEWSPWWGLGIAYVPVTCDVHVIFVRGVLGLSWQKEYPE